MPSLSPSPSPLDLTPSTFLLHLPRSQSSFAPLSASEIIAHISILRTLYLPPVHTCFVPDIDLYEDRTYRRGSSGRGRRESASLADTMDGLGMGLGLEVERRYDFRKGWVADAGDGEGEEDGVGDVEDGGDSDDDLEDGGEDGPHLDRFERDWAEKWLNGVVRRAQGWIEENEGEGESGREARELEAVLREATACLAMMAGTSAAGPLTRHLLFPVDPSLAPALRRLRQSMPANPDLSPETNTFLASLSLSPSSPISSFLRRPNQSNSPDDARFRPSTASEDPRFRPINGRHPSTDRSERSTPPSTALSVSPVQSFRPQGRTRGRALTLPIMLHDAPMSDHLSVGVQTWGSAILLARQMAVRPDRFGLSPEKGVRVLELGAGTGLLSILCRKLLDLHEMTQEREDGQSASLVVATDFLPEVLANLRVCLDLNFPPRSVTSAAPVPASGVPISGIHIAKLDWTTFPSYMARRAATPATENGDVEEEMALFIDEPFDLVLASDCVYDPTHAKMLKEVAIWVIRLPNDQVPGDQGGTFHILSPLRPTFAPELESIDTQFPLISSFSRSPMRRNSSAESKDAPAESENVPAELRGEGLGITRGLKLGTRGQGKRSIRGRRGEGRVDEAAGYWWWQVGWG